MFASTQKLFRLFVLLLSVMASVPGNSQSLSTEGRDFWFGFMNNWLQDPNNPIILEVYISADDSTSGILEVPKDAAFAPIEFNVAPGVTTRLSLSNNIMAQGTNVIENKGIHITTNNDVSVYAMNKRQYSADVAVILPTFSLGKEYFVMSHWEDGNRNNNDNSDSEFLIVGIEDGTEIEIIPSVSTEGGNPAGEPFHITLDEGEVYEVQARADLTGTKVTGINNQSGGCHNFALFAGNQYTKVGECNHPDGHDHLYAQQYPLHTWGREYITMNYEPRSGGDIVKILASEDNTSVQVNSSQYLLDAGEFVKLTLDGINTYTSDKPIAVGQFSRSQGCDNTRGDPFFILISPNEQLLEKITFNSPTIATVNTYSLNVIAKTAELQDITLDGRSIFSSFNVVPGNPEFSYAYVSTGSGNHTIRSQGGFICYVYGYGGNESFGYSAGANLENLNLDVIFTNSSNVELPSDSLCLNDVITFTPVVDTLKNKLEWSFGDGGKLTNFNLDPVDYQFENEGTYIFRLKASTEGDACISGNEETLVKVIKVVNPKNTILGPRSVCPNTTSVSYYLKNIAPFAYLWFVEGGTLMENYGDSIVVDWGETNADAGIKLLAKNNFDCYGDTIFFPVKINIQLDPEAPFGTDTLCSNDMSGILYNTYFTEGSTYTWYAESGIVADGQGSHIVNVDWSEYGTKKLWFEQHTVTDTICDGTSDTLFVFIQRDPSTVAGIVTEKDRYQMDEPFALELIADTLYQMVNWTFTDGHSIDSVLISSQSHSFNCPGYYDIIVSVYDTVGICPTKASGNKSLEILPLSLEMVNVTSLPETDTLLEINWLVENGDYLEEEITLKRRNVSSGLNSFSAVASFDGETLSFIDLFAKPKEQIYEYQVEGSSQCNVKTFSTEHNNVLLLAEGEDNLRANLEWNEYVNWTNGVDSYELYLSVDGNELQQIENMNGTAFDFLYDSAGFDYCFRIKAIENGGNQSFSWSNISCVAFVPPINVYNVITPNHDGKNDQFIIEGIEHYPNSVLTIFSRWGNKVLEKKGYQNNWDGHKNGNKLAAGVYYFVLELNDDRAKNKDIRGNVSILYGE